MVNFSPNFPNPLLPLHTVRFWKRLALRVAVFDLTTLILFQTVGVQFVPEPYMEWIMGLFY